MPLAQVSGGADGPGRVLAATAGAVAGCRQSHTKAPFDRRTSRADRRRPRRSAGRSPAPRAAHSCGKPPGRRRRSNERRRRRNRWRTRRRRHGLAVQSFGPQVPLTQLWPLTQSASVWQRLTQAPSMHWNGSQSCTPGDRQAPMPSQVPAVLIRSPLHDGATQTVSRAYLEHPPIPSQTPDCPQLDAGLGVQIPWGSAAPKVAAPQIPARPACAQLTQGAGAGDVAADAVGAEARGALRPGEADSAQRLRTATAVHALRADAIVVRDTGRGAGAGGRIAVERRADDGRPGGAGPVTVADPAPADRRAVAGPRLADRAEDEAAAGAGAVARPVEAAGRGLGGRADAGTARRPAGRHERAGPRRAGRVAGLARFGTRAVTADAVDTESTGAVPGAPASGAAGAVHLVGAVAGDRWRVAAAVVDRPVGAQCSRMAAASGGEETDPPDRNGAEEPRGSKVNHFAKCKPAPPSRKTRAGLCQVICERLARVGGCLRRPIDRFGRGDFPRGQRRNYGEADCW